MPDFTRPDISSADGKLEIRLPRALREGYAPALRISLFLIFLLVLGVPWIDWNSSIGSFAIFMIPITFLTLTQGLRCRHQSVTFDLERGKYEMRSGPPWPVMKVSGKTADIILERRHIGNVYYVDLKDTYNVWHIRMAGLPTRRDADELAEMVSNTLKLQPLAPRYRITLSPKAKRKISGTERVHLTKIRQRHQQ